MLRSMNVAADLQGEIVSVAMGTGSSRPEGTVGGWCRLGGLPLIGGSVCLGI